MKILLFGKNGQIGWELQRSLAAIGEVTALGHDSPAPLSGSFTDLAALEATVRAVGPDLIVNAAAHTGVDRAEAEPELAFRLNAEAPAVLAREAQIADAWLLHFSTDYVFDGSGSDPRAEDALTGPLGVYGRSKLAGEEAIRSAGARHLILRTSWVYAARGGNFAKTMLRLAGERDRLAVIDDQIGAPTGADLLADLSAHCALAVKHNDRLSGTYHVVAGGTTSWHGYACHVIETARRVGAKLRVGIGGIDAVPASAYPMPAARPKNSRLDTAKFRSTFGLTLPAWQCGVDRMLTEVLA